MHAFDAKKLRQLVHAIFPVETMAKGSAYHAQKRVLSCSITRGDGWILAAEVRGSQRKPYSVEIEILPKEDDLQITGTCSCPMGIACKHVAAVLLHVLDWSAEAMGEVFGAGGPARFVDANAGKQNPAVLIEPALDGWIGAIERAVKAEAEAAAGTEEAHDDPERLLFALRSNASGLRLELFVARALKAGGWGKARSYSVGDVLYRGRTSRFLRKEDSDLVRRALMSQQYFNTVDLRIEGDEAGELIEALVATGRCFWGKPTWRAPALTLGERRTGKPTWETDKRGWQKPTFEVTPAAPEVAFGVWPPWYFDAEAGVCGVIETGMPAKIAGAWLSAPAIRPQAASRVAEAIAERVGVAAVPAPRPIRIEVTQASEPVLRLVLHSKKLQPYTYGYGWGAAAWEPQDVGLARLEFDYGGAIVEFGTEGSKVEVFAEDCLRTVNRNLQAEAAARLRLMKLKLRNVTFVHSRVDCREVQNEFTLDKDADWFAFTMTAVPELRAEGWQVEMDVSFQYRVVEVDDWYGDAGATERNDWFGVELGVVIDGAKVNLLPILMRLLQEDPTRMSTEKLNAMADRESIPVPLPDGRNVLFPAKRAKQMLGVLMELMNPNALASDGRLRLNKLRAAEIAGEANWRWLGAAELQELSKKLRGFEGIKPVATPAGLQATLRPYQEEGIRWLQFLREYELSGILADDMGLGKTVQALAHLLVEKESGRMDRPSLVVAPTSLMTNWRQEAEKFAPALRVLVLHGGDRKQHFEKLGEHDLVVTSYPLLPRDQEVLLKQEFHCVILDEAQFIKNPKTLYAQVACQLKARHHLCLTGTPMENHLGELWSLFHFLLPGFLGDEIRFNGLFRRPIEKGRNDERRLVLAKRVAPFILRRRKEAVVKELPPKTEIVQNVELSGAQRDLYESVRLAMHEKVRAEVDRKGLSQAHIIILDALLKLRQICCHPQLLSLPSAQAVKESAKLELLMDQLPEMIEEGRRILLFSQFTSMLAIIERELEHRKIPHVILTGQTRDRATPVKKFQDGEVPLFLISLKAGGTGLNLTAADTVIHYDPWWNPAVENQATDRAHRIGQDKKVFVYKLMTVGTVEEKIAAMQARKRELVEGLLDEERRENVKLTAEDLEVLFAPIG